MEQKVLNLISSFSLLTNNENIQRLKKEIKTLEKNLSEEIQKSQANCRHDYKKIHEYEKDLFDKGGIIAKECRLCGHYLEKPQGGKSQVCERCWGTDLEYLGCIPGQGEHPSVYGCRTCHHEAVIN